MHAGASPLCCALVSCSGGAQGHRLLSLRAGLAPKTPLPILVLPLCKTNTTTVHRGEEKALLYQPGDKTHLASHRKKEKCP